MTEHEPHAQIQEAIDRLLERDAVLLINDTAERAITARLACYIQDQFPDWDVDCEYNRDFDGIKRLKEICNPSKHRDGSSVYPDIIIHRRMSADNFVVIEIKKTTNTESDECDMKKLEAFRYELGYQHGLFIRFRVGVDEVGIENQEWVF
ncbi:MAG: hypothetical protein AB2799_22205 [Candidatus Thiodiazotropha sp.]